MPSTAPLGAAERIQAHGCGVWKLFGKCFPDAETRRNVCVSAEAIPPPPDRLQLSSPSQAATGLLCQDPGQGKGPMPRLKCLGPP